MCGIAGFYRMGKVPIRDWQVTTAANMLEYRGNDATGIALMNNKGGINVLKNNEPAWKFTASKEYKRFLAEHLTLETQIVLIHTRKYTKGSPAKNDNNHPMSGGAGAIVHNGMIFNDDALFSANKGKRGWKRSGETDSDAIRALVDCHGVIDKAVIREMNLLEGVAAVGAFHPASPGKLLLLRDQNPLVIGATRDMLMFASDKTTIHKSIRPFVKIHNIWMQVHAPDLSFIPMPNQTGWIIGPGGFEDHDKFEANGARRTGNTKYSTLYNYHERQEKAKKEALVVTSSAAEEKKLDPHATGSEPKEKTHTSTYPTTLLPRFVVCANTTCNKSVELDDEDRAMESLSYLACSGCGENLVNSAQVTDFNHVN